MNDVFIIAEAGVNHNGSLELAKQLVDAAANAGADAVKFQTFKAENLVSKLAEKADYQKAADSREETQFEMIKKLEIDKEAHLTLLSYCKEKNIMFLSTPFDLDSVDMLNDLQLDRFKIPSGELTNLPLLRKIGGLKKQVILSTGMATMGEVERALEQLIAAGTQRGQITILHANTEYPTPMHDVNLMAMKTIQEAFKTAVGYSDHTLGIEVPVAAVALGATVIEKHFTLDKSMPGPDHKASLDPTELKQMVAAIRNIQTALGDGIKKPTSSESKNIAVARKSIVAQTMIKKGEVFTEKNINIKRPGNGISPFRWEEVLGRVAIKDFSEDELIVL